MTAGRIVTILIAVGMVMITGCSTALRYSPEVAAERIQRVGAPIPGKVLIHTTPEQDAYVFKGHPKSFAGAATSVKIPFGKMTKAIAIKTFEHGFSQGADVGFSARDARDHRVIIMPHVSHFEYLYRAAPGSLIRSVADIRMTLRTKVFDSRCRCVGEQGV